MDLTALLESRGDDAPSGENIEYDMDFISLELAAQPGEERQVGDSIIAAEEPDHAEVVALSQTVLERSHDLRAAVILAYSMLRIKGYPGLASVTGYIRGCLETWWDTCHPQLDADDDNDPTMRVNAIATLADPDTVLRGIRLAPMTESRTFGRFCLRDFAIAEGDMAAPAGMESVPDAASIAAAFQETDPERLAALADAAKAALADVRAIGKAFDDRIPGYGPDLEALEKLLKQAVSRFAAAGAGGAEATDETEAAGGDDSSGAPAPLPSGTASGGGGAINNQNDVRSTLDRLIAYYARAEPSSPLPLLLHRAKRLVGADFMTIIKDIAPDGRDNVRTVGGLSSDDDD